MQLACRDRNRLALEADLMGAAMHGIENISCLTGDDVTAGDEPEARRVFDLDGPQLIALARVLDSGRYLSGRSIGPAPHFVARRGRESRDAAVRRAACAAPRRRRSPARASCSCRSATARSCSSGSCAPRTTRG